MDDLGKVCVVLSLNGGYGVFLVDMNKVRLDSEKFFEIEPNLTIPFPVETSPYLFHVLKGSLYVFARRRSNQQRRDIPFNLEVYTIDLSSINGNTKLNLTSFEKCSARLGPKLGPKAVGYNGNLLLFSSEIKFRFENLISAVTDDDSLNDADFEIYDPTDCDYKKLPQLHVCRPDEYDSSSALRLYSSAKSTFLKEEFCDRSKEDGGGSKYFSIVSYCVDGDNFVVETDFGVKFCLKLDSVDDWRLCEECYMFKSIGRNIVTPKGVCYDAFGANDHRRRWLLQKQPPETRDEKRQKIYHGGEAECVGFPLTSIDDDSILECSSAVSLLKDDPSMPCIVRTAFDYPINDYGFYRKIYWFMDVLKLNLEEELDDEGKFVNRMMSFKFCVSRKLLSAYLLGLFYYN